ncbi:unnamed protein product [Amaranthus hypochondriacus]
MKDIDTKRPKRLDLDAPLMSARRANLTCATSTALLRANSLRASCERVPFSWEQSPGKPKDLMVRSRGDYDAEQGMFLPLPKPPLIRWQEQGHPTLNYVRDYGSDDRINQIHHHENDDDTSFSDAIDLFSLAESLNFSERFDLEGGIGRSNDGSLSPNFMIQRFLPAATALAASSLSALAANKELLRSDHSKLNHDGCSKTLSKGCGFQYFFPWRAKHKLCGVKSPVRRVRSSVTKF